MAEYRRLGSDGLLYEALVDEIEQIVVPWPRIHMADGREASVSTSAVDCPHRRGKQQARYFRRSTIVLSK